MSDTVIRVENLGKKYIIKHQQQGRSNYVALRDVMANGVKSLGRRVLKPGEKREVNPAVEEFWALKDVSFEIKRGDRVGIIGRNGAGKSTLLKVLSRITEPTTGRISLKGRVASLLEVGTGFHPELTGRENIYLNGAILGMGKVEIKKKFDEIVAFAEVEKFLDTPVKRYSSGMYVRLAFAVAAHLEPEILVVDEVLAVGDAQFQKKCLGKMEDVGKEGRTVIFVSHNIGLVQTLCNRGIVLQQGSVIADDRTDLVASNYLKSLEKASTKELKERTDRCGQGKTRLTKIEVSTGNNYSSILATGHSARFIFHISNPLPHLTCIFTLYDQHGNPLVSFNSYQHSQDDLIGSVNTKFVCEIDELLLIPGHYRMNVAISSQGELQDRVESATTLEVEPGNIRGRPVKFNNLYGSFLMYHRWILPG